MPLVKVETLEITRSLQQPHITMVVLAAVALMVI
jgi:hypothetical protein